ncbi:hypothetical protein TIFTF001_035719 [Ficus carica]|uniref:Uncharacterized protein n=1 Tax=Ficus carica TaxID=3494 RepID=A0AA88E2U5_FICCA|nr:hypothetical protein TIFTF001_035719 [Ficus carica]
MMSPRSSLHSGSNRRTATRYLYGGIEPWYNEDAIMEGLIDKSLVNATENSDKEFAVDLEEELMGVVGNRRITTNVGVEEGVGRAPLSQTPATFATSDVPHFLHQDRCYGDDKWGNRCPGDGAVRPTSGWLDKGLGGGARVPN